MQSVGGGDHVTQFLDLEGIMWWRDDGGKKKKKWLKLTAALKHWVMDTGDSSYGSKAPVGFWFMEGESGCFKCTVPDLEDMPMRHMIAVCAWKAVEFWKLCFEKMGTFI
jgi:hypothetical protein